MPTLQSIIQQLEQIDGVELSPRLRDRDDVIHLILAMIEDAGEAADHTHPDDQETMATIDAELATLQELLAQIMRLPPPITWDICPIDEYPLDDALFAAFPSDGTRGYLIGEMENVRNLRDALSRIICNREAHDGIVSHLDERLGWTWFSVSEASEKYGIPAVSIRWACAQGHISDAVKVGGRWRFPAATLRGWIRKRPGKGGRKPRNPDAPTPQQLYE